MRNPLATRIRPKILDDIIGQENILAKDKPLRRLIENDLIKSMILYGPPGTGKTTLAEIIASITKKRFVKLSAVLANLEKLREVLREAQTRKNAITPEETIVFIDEVHRFNKTQQDVLLPYVEDGIITFIAATTHNPFFFVNSPLVSRSQVFQFEPISENAILKLLKKIINIKGIICEYDIIYEEEVLKYLAKISEGDARRALNSLELVALSVAPVDLTVESKDNNNKVISLTVKTAKELLQKKAIVYDRDEDAHHDNISAFIKSVRGSNPNAAVYWLAKMLYSGEDPRFIARRLVILASEDIGNADPRGLTIAVAAMQAAEFVGMPEAQIILAQATTYLACAPKSNASYLAIDSALKDVENNVTHGVPKHLRSASYKGAAQLGHFGYIYPHDYEGHFIDQEYINSQKIYYNPTDQGYEDIIKKRLDYWESLKRKEKIEEGRDALQ